jgi:putative phage-type endonuclease
MPKIITFCEQGSQEWLDLKAGYISGSKMSDMMAGGKGLTRETYKMKLVAERLTGKAAAMSFKSAAMIKGNEDEPLAREHYAFMQDVEPVKVAFVYHDSIDWCGASPDSLINSEGFICDGILEIKCPNIETHIKYLLEDKIPRDYALQMQWLLTCCARDWCDWMTYSKEMPPRLRAKIVRVYRDEKVIKSLEDAAKKLNEEIDEIINKLGNLK